MSKVQCNMLPVNRCTLYKSPTIQNLSNPKIEILSSLNAYSEHPIYLSLLLFHSNTCPNSTLYWDTRVMNISKPGIKYTRCNDNHLAGSNTITTALAWTQMQWLLINYNTVTVILGLGDKEGKPKIHVKYLPWYAGSAKCDSPYRSILKANKTGGFWKPLRSAV